MDYSAQCSSFVCADSRSSSMPDDMRLSALRGYIYSASGRSNIFDVGKLKVGYDQHVPSLFVVVICHEQVYAVVRVLKRMRNCARTLFVCEILEELTIHLDDCLTFAKFAAPTCRAIRLKKEQ